MRSIALRIVALVLLIAVLGIFVSPAVDLDPTALRSIRAAQALLTGIFAAATVLAAFISLVLAGHIGVRGDFIAATHDHLFELNCSRLC